MQVTTMAQVAVVVVREVWPVRRSEWRLERRSERRSERRHVSAVSRMTMQVTTMAEVAVVVVREVWPERWSERRPERRSERRFGGPSGSSVASSLPPPPQGAKLADMGSEKHFFSRNPPRFGRDLLLRPGRFYRSGRVVWGVLGRFHAHDLQGRGNS